MESGWSLILLQATPDRSTFLEARRYLSRSNSALTYPRSAGFVRDSQGRFKQISSFSWIAGALPETGDSPGLRGGVASWQLLARDSRGPGAARVGYCLPELRSCHRERG